MKIEKIILVVIGCMEILLSIFLSAISMQAFIVHNLYLGLAPIGFIILTIILGIKFLEWGLD